MKLIKIATGIFLLLASALANADNIQSAPFNIQRLTLSSSADRLYIVPVGSVQVINSSCSSTSDYAFNDSATQFKSMYAMLLAAHLSGKQVRVWISDTTNDCAGSSQKVRMVSIL